MLGAFKPSPSLSGGLLWYIYFIRIDLIKLANVSCRKIPWRLSSTRKYRQRKRLRRVDNVVAILDTALKRDALSYRSAQDASDHLPASSNDTITQSTVLPSERRHGKGPKRGDYVPEMTPASTLKDNPPIVVQHSDVLLADEARAKGTFKLLERWKAEMPTEAEMLPKNKYTMFDRKVRGFRKGVHKLPKWTRVSQRLNPPGY